MSSNSLKNQFAVIILLFTLLLISEYVSNKLFNLSLLRNLESLLLLAILILICFLGIEYFTRKKLLEVIKTDFENFKTSTKDDLKNISLSIEKISTNWLKMQSEINTIEKEMIKGTQIWIITPDLKNDTNLNDPQIKEIIAIVKKNMGKGICYAYIVPDKDSYINIKIKELENIFAKYKSIDRLKIVRIDKDYFSLFGNMCFTIYNPEGVNGHSPKVYLELPREEKKWWVELSETQAATFVGKISEIINQSQHT